MVVTGDLRDRRSSCEQVRQVLASIGSPAPVIGFVARDPAGARGLWAGELTRRFTGSDLVRTARATAEAVLATWPELVHGRTGGRRAAAAQPLQEHRRPVNGGFGDGGSTIMTDAPLDRQLVEQLRGRVADELTRGRQDRDARGERELSFTDERQLALSVITRVVQRHLASVLTAGGELPADPGFDLKLIMAVDASIFEAGELQELLDNVDVENIDINGCDEVFITYADHRGKVRGRPIAASDDDLIQIVQNLASYASMNARPWTPANPELDLRLPDGSRLSAVMSAAERPVVSIRRNRYPQMFLSTLVDLGTVDDQLACFLQAAVTARMNIRGLRCDGRGKDWPPQGPYQRCAAGRAADHRGAVPGVGAAAAPGAAPGRGGTGGGTPGRGRQRRPDDPGPGAPHPKAQPGQNFGRRSNGS